MVKPTLCPKCGSSDLQFEGFQAVRVIEDRTAGEVQNYEIPDGPTGHWTQLSGHCLSCGHDWVIIPAPTLKFEVEAIPADIRAVIRDRAACGGWLAPVTQAEWLAWLLDEARLQTEQAEAALEAEERQVRLKCLAALNAVITQLTHAGVLPVSLPWQKGTVKLAERWVDGLREGVARVNAEVSVDSYGVSVTAEITGGPVAEVLVEFYDGAVTARVWDSEAYGGDPTTIELFKVESQGGTTW